MGVVHHTLCEGIHKPRLSCSDETLGCVERHRVDSLGKSVHLHAVAYRRDARKVGNGNLSKVGDPRAYCRWDSPSSNYYLPAYSQTVLCETGRDYFTSTTRNRRSRLEIHAHAARTRVIKHYYGSRQNSGADVANSTLNLIHQKSVLSGHATSIVWYIYSTSDFSD